MVKKKREKRIVKEVREMEKGVGKEKLGLI